MKAFSASEVGLTEIEALDLRAHRAVDEQDALGPPRLSARSARPRGAPGRSQRRGWETNSFRIPLQCCTDIII